MTDDKHFHPAVGVIAGRNGEVVPLCLAGRRQAGRRTDRQARLEVLQGPRCRGRAPRLAGSSQEAEILMTRAC